MTCGDSIVSNKLRKLGLESHGKRLGGRRKERQPEPEPKEATEETKKDGRKERLLYEVSDERLAELHARGLNDNAITTTLIEEGFSAYQSGVSRRLRKMGLAAHGSRNGGGRKPKEVAEEAEEDEGPFYRKPEELVAEPAPKKRRGRPRKNSAQAEEGEYPVIGKTIYGTPMVGSMRMKVVEEKIVDGHKVKVLPPGYAQGAYPAKNVSVRS
jgi:hypothetical protein